MVNDFNLWAWVLSLPQNAMFAGLTGATVVGSVLMLARRLPSSIVRWSMMLISSEVTVKSQDPAFWWIVHWLSETPYGRRTSRMRLETGEASPSVAAAPLSPGQQSPAAYVLSPADGRHWFFHRSALVVLNRGREESGSSQNSFARETLHMRVLTLKGREYIGQLIREAESSLRVNIEATRVHHNGQWGWGESTLIARRPIQSVILREGVAEMLVKDVETFRSSQDWYRDRSIPWRRGYLLHGVPGCGKSSIAHALASHLGMDVAVLSLSCIAGDAALRSTMNALPKNCLLLIEDLDAAFNKREGKDTEQVTFSGLLNAIDGVSAAEGRILMMTTNHLELIDPALRRPGRADLQIEIQPADADQARRLFLRFFPDEHQFADVFAERNAGRAPASIQGVLLEHRDDPHAACAAHLPAALRVAA